MSRYRATLTIVVTSLLAALIGACGDTDQAEVTAQATGTTAIAPTTTRATTPPPTTTTSTLAATTVTTSLSPQPPDEGPLTGLIHFGVDGITVAPFEGDAVAIPGDRFYPNVWRAEPDGAGGIVYQLLDEHASWPQGTIFRLAAGTIAPQPAFVPSQDTRTELYGVIRYNDELSILLGQQHLGQRDWTALVVVPLASAIPRELMTMEGLVDDVSYGGGMFVAATPTSSECSTPEFFDGAGEPLDPPASLGCKLSQVTNPHLTTDGSLLVYQTPDYIGMWSLETGDSWRIEGYLVDFDGRATLVAVGPEPGEAWLVEVGPDGFGDRTAIDDPGWAVLYHRPIEVAEQATLDLQSPEVECSAAAMGFDPVPVDLPTAVAAKRDAIAAAAIGCDFAELGSLAEPHESFDFYTSCCAFRSDMEGDPVRYWLIGETAATEEMLQLVRLLQMEPGRIDGGWVWPAAVVQDEAAIDWPALEELFAGPYEVLYEVSRDRGYYNGFVVEITDTGRWRMFKQVIEPPIAG